MPIRWTPEQIIELAPDAQVAKAARGLARLDKWILLQRDGRTLWGECTGSGQRAYRVAVDLEGPAFKCNCPSRKRPCKHALGLLLLARAEPAALREAGPADWVSKWLAARARPSRTDEVADPGAQKRRAGRRVQRVRRGVAVLSRWLEDLLQRGLAGLADEPLSFWNEQAARLVDAQAPGLARRVQALGAVCSSGEGWPARLLDQLGRLHLLVESFQRLDELPPALQEDVRTQVGWPQEKDAALSQPALRDRWLVLGRREDEEDRLRGQRTWLWGLDRRQPALILDYATPKQSFETNWIPGTGLEAELSFWPGGWPQRALLRQTHGTCLVETLPGYPSLREALGAYGQALAGNPWLELFPMPLERVVPLRQGDGWIIRDEEGDCLPLHIPALEGWRLLALSGGEALALVGEWDGYLFMPLSAWAGRELVPLGGGG